MRQLWEVAQVPDFQSVLTEAHTRLLQEVFLHLSGPTGRLPEDWVLPQVRRLDHAQGEVDALLHRIAAIRTWTYISHRSGWLADPGLWQERTRGIEDRLSDALHERLTAQFVDRRATVIARQDPHALLVEVDERDEVLVQGLAAGRLRGFVFEPDPSLRDQAKGLLAAANRGLRAAMPERIRASGTRRTRLLKSRPGGPDPVEGRGPGPPAAGGLRPRPPGRGAAHGLLAAPREAVRKRLLAFVEATLRRTLAPFRVRDAPPAARRGAGLHARGRPRNGAAARGGRAGAGPAAANAPRALPARSHLRARGRVRARLAASRGGARARRPGRHPPGPAGPWPDGGASLPAAPPAHRVLLRLRVPGLRTPPPAGGRARFLRGRASACGRGRSLSDRSRAPPPGWAAPRPRSPPSCGPSAMSSGGAASSRRAARIGGPARPGAPSHRLARRKSAALGPDYS